MLSNKITFARHVVLWFESYRPHNYNTLKYYPTSTQFKCLHNKYPDPEEFTIAEAVLIDRGLIKKV